MKPNLFSLFLFLIFFIGNDVYATKDKKEDKVVNVEVAEASWKEALDTNNCHI